MFNSYFKIPIELRCHFWKVKRGELLDIIYTLLFFKSIYKQRHRLFAMGEIHDNLHLPYDDVYWLVNNTERVDGDNSKPLNYVRCWYGDEGFQKDNNFDYLFATQKQKYIQAKKWIRRNNRWNGRAKDGLKFLVGFKVKEVIANCGGAGATTWRNKKILGLQCVLLERLGTTDTYFRYSFTKPFIFGYWINVMLGVETRYILKVRIFDKYK